MNVEFGPKDALIVVDVQNDFCPGGALAVPEGDRVIPVLNQWIANAVKSDVPVFASRDWHPPDHMSFADRGGPWPVHCVQGTDGAEFEPRLALPGRAEILSKGTHPDREDYSAFGGTDLARQLRERGVERVWIGGLAQDYCVRHTVLDALKEGFEAHLIVPGTKPVNLKPEDGARALQEMRSAGAVLEDEKEVA